jgi:hypothetical protein
VTGKIHHQNQMPDHTLDLGGTSRRHHAFQHRAVLGRVHALRVRSDPAFRRACRGMDASCAQRRIWHLRDGRQMHRQLV